MRLSFLLSSLLLGAVFSFAQQSDSQLDKGTVIPLTLVTSVQTSSSTAGQTVGFKTSFPVLQDGHIVLPAGSWVHGTVTDVKRAGHAKGRSEMHIRIDSLILENGVSKPLNAMIVKAGDGITVDRSEGTMKGGAKPVTICPTKLIINTLTVRGPDIVLRAGDTVEISLVDPLSFSKNDLDFSAAHVAQQ